ncbi:PREDICTED: uncharacterized protein LOC109461730 [Branchiostoma belcheri]|uniref:Uncharacterized protein LOC109461730 n=1 Tax=Branchiostoma belcheri TaxID=7741 RepID=A0A6P4XSN5_BRABE|nr:PREDICTED: uncharacterized protein LOC109461730 [Branchiostoma belcheri]XP_019613680.1 PREDICTED: uncharacterized protein LOC109461730 [Branchiostoma belcheri]
MPSFEETWVHRVGDVHKGDQLVVKRGDIKHHMIVTEDPTNLREVHVIHYYNDTWPGVRGVCACCGKSVVPIAEVREDVENIASDVSKGRVYRIDWHNKTFSPDETVQRAKSRLGEGKYCPFTNNCEHFGTWCKTGREESLQSQAVCKEGVKEIAKSAVIRGAKQVAMEGAKTVMKEGAKQVAMEGAKTVVKEGAKQVAMEGAKTVVKEGAKQIAMEGAKTVVKEGAKQVAMKGAKTVVKEGAKSVAREWVKQVAREEGKAVMTEAGHGVLMQMLPVLDPNFMMRQVFAKSHAMLDPALVDVFQHTLVKESSKQLAEEGGKTVMKEGAKSVAKEGAKQVASEGGKNVVKEGAKSVAKEGTKQVVGEGAKTATKTAAKESTKTTAKESAKTAAKESAKTAAKEGTKAAAKSGGKSFGKKIIENQGKIGIALTVAEESYYFLSRTSESVDKLKNGMISGREFVAEVATHAVKGVASGTATVVGATLGQTLIPIPVVGSAIGAMIGKGVVGLGGWLLGL